MKKDGTVPLHSRTQAARDAGLSERQRKMAERIQARAIRRYGELLKQIEPGHGNRYTVEHDGGDMLKNRTQAATQAGISERQKVTALRIANIPAPDFDALIESDTPPTITKLAELGKQERKPPARPKFKIWRIISNFHPSVAMCC